VPSDHQQRLADDVAALDGGMRLGGPLQREGLSNDRPDPPRDSCGHGSLCKTLFAERGYGHVAVSDIAKAAEVSEPTVYNYFPTKERLVLDRDE
jgi:Bacterial regulatory proteins, tetR family